MNLILLNQQDFVDQTRVRLNGRRLQHILAIHRAEVGQQLVVGLENGKIGRGEILQISQSHLEMQIFLDHEPPPPLELQLILGLPRPKMLKRVLISAISMGVKQIWLINSYRVEKSFWGSPQLTEQKLKEPAILGLEQAGDTLLPVIRQRKLFKPFVEDELPALIKGTTALVAHPGGAGALCRHDKQPVTLAIGPEGGFIPYEIEKLQQTGFNACSFGPRILRVETAVPALLSRFMKE